MVGSIKPHFSITRSEISPPTPTPVSSSITYHTMSRSITSTLRPLLHTRPQPIASTSTLPSISQFSTTSPNLASRVKQNAKRKVSKVLSLRQARESEESNPPDPVLGYSLPPSTSSRQSTQTTPVVNRWEGCRLQKTILTPEQVYSAPLVQSSSSSSSSSSSGTGNGTREYIHGLSSQDQDILFGAVPYTTLGLSVGTDAGVEEQERQVENMKRILDLRNASKAGIEVVNRQRIVEEFGRKRVLIKEGEWGYEGEPQSGGSEVQGRFYSFYSLSNSSVILRSVHFPFHPLYLIRVFARTSAGIITLALLCSILLLLRS